MGRPREGEVVKLPSGRYRVRVTCPDGVRRSAGMTFVKKADATQWLSARNTDMIRAGADWLALWESPRAGLTFVDYAASWLARREVKGRPIAEWTRVRYQSLLDRHILPTFGRMQLTTITREAVQQWYAGLLKDKPTTRSHAYALLRAIMRTAAYERLVAESVVDIRGAGSSSRKRSIRVASVEELRIIVEAMPERLRLAVLLGSWCALRYGEVAELRRTDIVTRENGAMAVRVSRGVTWPHSATEPVVGPPKSEAGVREVTIPAHLVPVVKHHLATYCQWGKDGLLFPSPTTGTQIHAAAFHKSWSKARAAAERDDLRFHDLRRTGATMAAQSGATIGELMQRLGHSTPAAAMRYQQASQERDELIAARLSAMAERR